MLLYNGSLVINDVHAEEAGVYKCIGYTNTGPVLTFAVQLVLACKYIMYSILLMQMLHYYQRQEALSLLPHVRISN